MLLPLYWLLPLTWVEFAALFAIFLVLFYIFRRQRKAAFRKPFDKDARTPFTQIEAEDKPFADLRLEQPFNPHDLPDEIDAIVIGSGIGGLATAAILSKTSRKVVVLEKHSKAGGCCSSFIDHGYEWDIGVDYIGHMGPAHFERFFLDQLTEGQLEWQQLNPDCDNVVLVKSADESKRTIIPMWGDRDRLLSDLIKRYPQHEDGLHEFFDLMDCSAMAFNYLPYFKSRMPMWLAKLMTKLRLHNLFTNFFIDYNEVTVKSRLDHLFGEGDLEIKHVLNYWFGIHGVLPSKAGAGMMAFAYDYFAGSAYYPVGGAYEIPYALIPTIEKSGGRVLVNANVTEILVSNGKATGVRITLDGSGGSVEIKAPIIISNAGVSNTFRKLLPKEIARETKIGQILKSGRIKPGMAMFQAFIGLKGSQAELNLPAKNFWIYHSNDIEKSMSEWYSLDLETAVYKAKIPFIFVTFPSAKDPTYNERHPDRSACKIITLTPYEWFRKWENEPVKCRSSEYKAAKIHLAERCWELVLGQFPQLADRKDFLDAASPLSTAHYINAFSGEPSGLSNDTERFSPDVALALRPKVAEIENLYLTGQDVLAHGFVTCLYSALMTCDTILCERGECKNLLEDLKRLFNANPPKVQGLMKEVEMESSLGNMANEE